MEPKHDFVQEVTTLATYGWVFLLSMFGGLAAFIRKLNQSREPLPLRLFIIKLTGELVVSAFAGLITFFLCKASGASEPFMAVMIATAGHLGGRAIDGIGRIVMAVLDSKGPQA